MEIKKTTQKIIILTLILFLTIITGYSTLNVALTDQGTGVSSKSTGDILTTANLTIEIYDAQTGGNLIYNQTFQDGIINGSWNVMLGETIPLSLEYGKIYYRAYKINGESATFTNGTGQTVSRQFFYSPLGDISDEDISDTTNLTIGSKITFALGGLIDNLVNSWLKITGNLNITGNVTINSPSLKVAGKNVCLQDGTNCPSTITDTRWNISSSNYLINESNILKINETKLNETIDARTISTNDTQKTTSGNYLYNDSTTIYFNGTKLNITINNLENDTLYYAGGVYIYKNGTNYFLINETKLNATIDARENNTLYTNGSGLELTGTTFSIIKSCSNNQILKWDNSTSIWLCSNETTSTDTNCSVDGSCPNIIYESEETNLNVNYSKYSNQTTWWGNLSSWAIKWFFKNGNSLDINETKLNATIDARTTPDTQKTTSGNYLYNDSTTIYFNETKINITINNLENDTLYYAGGVYIYKNGTNYFIVNETKLNSTIDARTIPDTQKTTSGNYLYNDSTIIYFNETKLNSTIDARDTDTISNETNKIVWTNNSNEIYTKSGYPSNVNVSGTIYAENFSSNSPLRLQTGGTTRIYVDDTNGEVGIGTSSPEFKLTLDNDGGIIAKGTYNSGNTLTTAGSGARMIWYPRKAAFRAGLASGNVWNDSKIGSYSTAFGAGTTANKSGAFASGIGTIASGYYTFAHGDTATASGDWSTAIGYYAQATGDGSVAIGVGTEARGDVSTAIGDYTIASGVYSTAMGELTTASGYISTAIGENALASGDYATAIGTDVTAQSYASVVIGKYNIISGTNNSWISTEPLFVVGNGISSSNRSNAMTILKNGNIGIGTISPTHKLNINGSANITQTIYSFGQRVCLENGTGCQQQVSDTQKTTNGFYLYNDSTTIYFNETKINITINNLENDTLYYADGVYIYKNTTNYFIINETKLNSTIDARDTDTISNETNKIAWTNNSNQIHLKSGYPTYVNISNAIFINGSNKYIGINITNASQPLHVVGQGINKGAIRIDNNGAGATLVANRIDGKAVAIHAGPNSGAFTFDDTGVFKIYPRPKSQILTGTYTGAPDYFAMNGTTGDIGIGTENPKADLHIYNANRAVLQIENGNFTATQENIINFTHNGRSAQIRSYLPGSNDVDLKFYTMDSNTLYERMIITGNGDVGIGTASPINKLDINGTTLIRGNLNVTGTSYLGDVIIESENITTNNIISRTGDLNFYNNSYDQNVVIKEDGKVGIGTITPTHELHTVGSANITQTIYSQGHRVCLENGTGCPTDIDTQKTTSGNYLYNDSTTIYLNETQLNITINNLENDTLYYAGGVYIYKNGTNYFIINETQLNSTIDARDTDTISNETNKIAWTNDSTQIRIKSGYPNYINISDALYINGTNGRIGIGTQSPEDKFHVSGGNIILDNNQVIQIKDTEGTVRNVVQLDSSNDTIIGGTHSARRDLILNTAGVTSGKAMIIKKDTGYIGIGTSIPQVLLHLNSTTNSAIAIEAGGGFTKSLQFRRAGEIDHEIYENTAEDLIIEAKRSNEDITFKVNKSGTTKTLLSLDASATNVKINDLNHNNGLTLQTENNTGNTRINFQNNGGAYTWSIYREDAGSNQAHLVFSGGVNQNNLEDLAERMRIINTGEVGIATASPQYQLDINGTIGTSNSITSYSTSWNFTNLILGNSDNVGGESGPVRNGEIHFQGTGVRHAYISYMPKKGYLYITGRGTSYDSHPMSLLVKGKIGIGTDTSTLLTHTLNVNGSANITGTIYADNFSSNSPLRLQTGGTTRILVNDSNGYVGIRTSSPRGGLEINGSILRTGSRIYSAPTNPETAVNLGINSETIGYYNTIGGGYNNNVTGYIATISGGEDNTATGVWSTVGGGKSNYAGAYEYATTVCGGEHNRALSSHATVTGGSYNTAHFQHSFVGGGWGNNAYDFAVAIGGSGNNASGWYSTVSGGASNTASGWYSAISGGNNNNVLGRYSAVVGGANNDVYGNFSFVGGGYRNIIYGNYSSVLGGWNNSVSGDYSYVGGGYRNNVSSDYSVISGGNRNKVNGTRSVLVGGEDNTVSEDYAAVLGGDENIAGGDHSIVLGGDTNRAYGTFSAVGGKSNFASGNYSWVFGSYMNTTINATNTFVWGFSNFSAGRKNIESPNSFLIFPAGVNGKVGIGTITPTHKLNINGSANITGTIFAENVNISGNLQSLCGHTASFWAEESVALNNATAGGLQFSWGNGNTGGYGYVHPCSGTVVAMTLNCVTGGDGDVVGIAVNGVEGNSECRITTTSGSNTRQTDTNCITTFNAGDAVTPITITSGNGATGCIIGYIVHYN